MRQPLVRPLYWKKTALVGRWQCLPHVFRALGLFLLLSFWGCETTQNRAKSQSASSSSSVGNLGKISIKDLNGRWVYFGDVLGKKVLLVTFWATWCGPCKQELRELGHIQRKLKGQGLQIFAVNTDPPASMGQVRTFVRRHRLQVTVLMDQESRLLKQLNPKGNLPFYVLFNRQGKWLESHQGYQPGDEVQIEGKLRKLLSAQ